jgi:hypothetical protein
MAGDPLVCQHDRTPDVCEDCAYLRAVEVGLIPARDDLASRGPDRAPFLPTASDVVDTPTKQSPPSRRKS